MKMRPFDNIITCSQPRIYIRFLRALLLKSIDHRATTVCTHIARDRRHWMDGDETSTESDRTILIASHSAQCTLEHIHTDIQRMAAFINIFLFALRFLRVCLFCELLCCFQLFSNAAICWYAASSLGTIFFLSIFRPSVAVGSIGLHQLTELAMREKHPELRLCHRPVHISLHVPQRGWVCVCAIKM